LGLPIISCVFIQPDGKPTNSTAMTILVMAMIVAFGGTASLSPMKNSTSRTNAMIAMPIFTNGQLIQSIPDAIAKVLETHTGAVNVKHQDIHVSNCPICGPGLNDEKCPTCANCGWSKCNGV